VNGDNSRRFFLGEGRPAGDRRHQLTTGFIQQTPFAETAKAGSAFTLACAHGEAAGATLAPLDFALLDEAAALLYQGPGGGPD